MLSEKSIHALQNNGYQYILGARLKNKTVQIKERILRLEVAQAKLKELISKHGRLLVSFSSKRAYNNRKNRQNGLKRLEKRVKSDKLTKDHINNRGYNIYLTHSGIKKFSFVVPGYSHTFKEQVTTFMKRVKVNYTDSVENKAVILYAWGDEWRPYRYYKAKKSAKNGANDFAIFQHMLEDFITDSVYFASHPKDFTIYLTCTSMGNQLLKEYLLERERQGIPLIKVYKTIMLLGSDASWDSFEPGKGFYNIGEMCDTVSVVYHDKDVPLKMSTVFNLRRRMGLHGPQNPDSLPDYVRTYDIGHLLTKDDKSGLYHDYLLTNAEFQKLIRDDLKEDD